MRPAALFSFASVALAVLSSSVGAWPKSAPKMITARVAANAAALRFGKSVGSPTAGHLLGGSRLDDTPYLHVLPHDVPGDVRWGLTPLVSMIDRGARTVQKKYPGSVLEVGHLSRAGGGDVGDHASHESGRDADIAFYVKNNVEKQVFSDHMVQFRGDGSAPSWPGAKFDDAKNWALISSFVQDPANVTHIFVSAPIRARLLAYAEKNGAAPAVRNRAAELMMQPHGSLPHDDHFHVRIGCPAGQRECVENPQPKKKLQITHVPKPKRRDRAGAPPAPSQDDSVEAKPSQKSDSPASQQVAPQQEEKGSGSSDESTPEAPAQSGDGSGTSVILAAPNDPPEGD
jgi:penicillin-insensitive murein endopeptidase